jgi:hypothetical protein
MGDAKATAHFSIGSGTKLAIEDAIALFESFRKTRREGRARAFENDPALEVERTQHAADVSLVWFEHVDRFLQMDPLQFAFGLMTRSKAITWDNLALRAPEFVGDVGEMFAGRCARRVFPSTRDNPRRRCFSRSAARHDARQPRRRLADVHVFGGRRDAERLAPRASRQPRDRRRRPRLHGNDRRFRGRAHFAGLRRYL